ncbi:hypothetical protein IMCC21906_00068 [Spongiibacter sp. IMCC21906]|uniref:hypothetical protein n=1 Tax=Spongiibacter sp. IMCC21906 TaxID=1620392 RepID=UPI00062DFE74|nr:hypothetical protein [Spongiibacter sp. IMCC21906]AKH67763.1 hypothetical protein IMCC21906_00068 [Spongiibacter sp. IMCC21906]
MNSTLKPPRKAVTIQHAWFEWRLQEDNLHRTQVEAIMFMDPAGPTPAGLLNYLSVSQPGENIQKNRNTLSASRYSCSAAALATRQFDMDQ